MIEYILKSSLSLLLMFGLYWVLLRREKLFIFNRYFLIFSILFSLVVPFISIPINIQNNEVWKNLDTTLNNNIFTFSSAANHFTNITNQPQIEIEPLSEGLSSEIIFFGILLILYVSGVILLLLRFIRNIYFITHQIRLSEKTNYSGQRLVLIEKQINPYCFFNTIFAYKHDYLNNKIDKELLTHELEHVRQSHSLDIIFIELIQIFYWFNPILILYNRAVRVNHEYLADNGVIKETLDIKNYAAKLLCLIGCNRNIPLTSGFNHSLTRKRLIMMTKSDSGQLKDCIRILLTLSLMIIFFFILGINQSNSQSTNGETGLQAQTVKDIDGNVYNTVTIGTQVWMKENLKTTKYNDGTAIPNIKVDSTWASLTTGAYCDYLNTPTNSTTYGRLYNWYVVDNNAATKVLSNGSKNVCPTGWHVPTDLEWAILKTYLGGDSVTGGKLKETGATHWVNPNWGATNESGFTALPGGCRYYYGAYSRMWDEGIWWSTTEFFYSPTEKNATLAFFSTMHYDDVKVSRDNGLKNNGFSIRCLKDTRKKR
jgi:uncharacterized protein (TIGR02145 family)